LGRGGGSEFFVEIAQGLFELFIREHFLELAPRGLATLALVANTLYASGGRRPTRLGGPFERPGADVEKAWQSAGLPPDEVGKRVLDAVAKAEFFIFTHEEPREWIEARHRRLMAGFDSIARYQAENRET